MKRYNYMSQDDLNFKRILAMLELGSRLGWFSSTNTEVRFEDFMEKDKEQGMLAIKILNFFLTVTLCVLIVKTLYVKKVEK